MVALYRDIDDIPIYWSKEKHLIDALFSLMMDLFKFKCGLYESLHETDNKNKIQDKE